MGPDHVEVQGIPYPKLELDSMSSPVESERQKRKCNHGAILKVVTTNICGSDQHMVRGRTSLPGGHMVLGHEITGEIVELGDDCEFLNVGDVCSVPFNIACGRCAACKRGDTGVCLNVNPARAGAAYGYVDMGGWIGGQSEYVMVPYADFNLLKFPDKDQAIEKIKDLTLLSDIFPTGFHGAIQAGVKPGSIVYVAGAGPVGLASAASCHLLGAACVIVGDMIPERLAQAKSFGCETIDLRTINGSLKDAIADMIPGSNGEVVSQASCCTQRTTHNAAQPPQLVGAVTPTDLCAVLCLCCCVYNVIHRTVRLTASASRPVATVLTARRVRSRHRSSTTAWTSSVRVARSVSPVSTLPPTRAASMTTRRLARSRCASASAGPSLTRS
jgi:glutathione-independent formaldehyde dehydrogenase